MVALQRQVYTRTIDTSWHQSLFRILYKVEVGRDKAKFETRREDQTSLLDSNLQVDRNHRNSRSERPLSSRQHSDIERQMSGGSARNATNRHRLLLPAIGNRYGRMQTNARAAGDREPPKPLARLGGERLGSNARARSWLGQLRADSYHVRAKNDRYPSAI